MPPAASSRLLSGAVASLALTAAITAGAPAPADDPAVAWSAAWRPLRYPTHPPTSARALPDGRVVLAGALGAPAYGQEPWAAVVTTDPDGRVLATSHIQARTIALDEDGTAWAIGASGDLMRYEPSSGRPLWGEPLFLDARLDHRMLALGDGELALVGWSRYPAYVPQPIAHLVRVTADGRPRYLTVLPARKDSRLSRLERAGDWLAVVATDERGRAAETLFLLDPRAGSLVFDVDLPPGDRVGGLVPRAGGGLFVLSTRLPASDSGSMRPCATVLDASGVPLRGPSCMDTTDRAGTPTSTFVLGLVPDRDPAFALAAFARLDANASPSDPLLSAARLRADAAELDWGLRPILWNVDGSACRPLWAKVASDPQGRLVLAGLGEVQPTAYSSPSPVLVAARVEGATGAVTHPPACTTSPGPLRLGALTVSPTGATAYLSACRAPDEFAGEPGPTEWLLAVFPDAGPPSLESVLSGVPDALGSSSLAASASAIVESSSSFDWTNVVVRHPETGAEMARHRLAGALAEVVTDDDGRVLVVVFPTAGRLDRLDPATGRLEWSAGGLSDPRALILGGDVLVASSASWEAPGVVSRLDARTGRAVWSQPNDLQVDSVLASDGLFLVIGWTPGLAPGLELRSYDAADGTPISRASLPRLAWPKDPVDPPTSRSLVVARAGRLAALAAKPPAILVVDVRSGRQILRHELASELTVGALEIVGDDVVAVGVRHEPKTTVPILLRLEITSGSADVLDLAPRDGTLLREPTSVHAVGAPGRPVVVLSEATAVSPPDPAAAPARPVVRLAGVDLGHRAVRLSEPVLEDILSKPRARVLDGDLVLQARTAGGVLTAARARAPLATSLAGPGGRGLPVRR